MPHVRIADRRIRVGDDQRALLAGEVHYWRLDPAVWPAVLRRSREFGLDVLSTYVCWDFHETAPGHFDFVGQTNARRNLVAFVELVRNEGFWLLLRPGPYIYAEWPNSGVPERVVRWHRLHPSFVDEAKVWMRSVVDVIKPFLATRAGPVVLLQADNEADPWLDVYGAQLGLADTPGLFHDFLRQRYEHVADLNAAWSADLTDFSEARAVLSPAFEAFMPRYLDVCRFQHWYATEVVRWTCEEYRRLGIDVPIYANTYTGTRVQDWRAIDSVCDLAGPDIYPTARLADDPAEHRRLLDAVRYARTFASVPFIPEFECGIWHGWHANVGTLQAKHYELNAFAALQSGACGWNWYMLASRDSWYMSPISELGRFRPELSPAFAEIVRLFRALDPPSLSKLTDTAVTFNALERGAGLDVAGQDVLQALHSADLDYELFDLDSGQIWKPLLLYAGGRVLSVDQRRRLEEYVEAGGTLVLFQPPLLGGLAREPARVGAAAVPRRVRLTLGEAQVELSSPAIFVYADAPGQAITAERTDPLPPTQEGGHAHVRLPVGERMRVGYLEERGRGRVIVLGVPPEPELLLAVHTWLGVRIACRVPAGSRVHSALFRRGDERLYSVVLTNTSDEVRDVTLAIDVEAPLSVGLDLRTGAEATVDDGRVIVRVPPRSGTVVQLR